MSDTLKQRIELHVSRSLAAGNMAAEHGSPHDATWALVQAVHDLGITTATVAQTSRVDESEIEQLGVDVSAIATAAHMVRENIDRAMKGMAPWGAMRESLDALNRAVDKVVMR